MQVSVELSENEDVLLNELVRVDSGAFTRQQILDTALVLGISFISQEAIDAHNKDE